MKSVAAGIYEDNTQLSIGSVAVSQKVEPGILLKTNRIKDELRFFYFILS